MRFPFPLLAAALAACAPALDWRDVRPPGTNLAVLFPCKPTEEVRRLPIAGIQADMAMLACQAGGKTWALGHLDLQDPARVSSGLDELAAAAVRNIGASAAVSAPLHVTGMTPNPRSVRLSAKGVLPDGTTLHAETAVFAKGTRIFQATVLAPGGASDDAETFFTSVRWP